MQTFIPSLNGREIMIIGGTGSLGTALIKLFLYEQNMFRLKGLRIYSRDEFKQFNLRNNLKPILEERNRNSHYDLPISFLIGDVRDRERLQRAMTGVDIVINAAAMKQVPCCEDNPLEAVKTNVLGACNIIEAAIDAKVSKVLHVSTDKAVYPINLYGATKTVAEKLFIHANTYSPHTTKFSCCRYGNVLGSRGSLIPFIRGCYGEDKKIPLTHPEMSRFFISLKEVTKLISVAMMQMNGKEIFIPKMHSMYIRDVIDCVVPGDRQIYISGIRPGEKLKEVLISEEETKHCVEYESMYVIHPDKIGNSDISQSGNQYDSGFNNPLFQSQKEDVFKFLQQRGEI